MQNNAGNVRWFGVVMLLIVVAALHACSAGPLNGTVVDGDYVGRSFSFEGFTLAPNDHVLLEVLNTPTSDPDSAASWTQFLWL